ncbi:MAG: sigma D regulator [Gammaproteobacteria bacterium]|nr:sigma D regulator [Gammaproteobacteria bacterium]
MTDKERDRRSGSVNLVKKLTAERAELLVLYCRVAGLSPYTENRDSQYGLLEQLCQMLVDYVAAGHFSLYERIVSGKERRQQVIEMAEDLYPRITRTTDVVLDFNDKYDCEDNCPISNDFDEDLSVLGEILAERIELEDRLLAAMC